MKSILISNNTGQNAQVIIIQDTNNQLSLGPDSLVKFELTKPGDSSSTRYIYGLGMFSEGDLKSFNTMIKQIQIMTESDTCEVNGKNLHKLLPKKRQGLFKSELEIKISNCPQ